MKRFWAGRRRWLIVAISLILFSYGAWPGIGGREASAETFGDFTYADNHDGTATITDYTGSGGEVVIPRSINDLTVTELGYRAMYNKEITTVTIPDSIIRIGDSAFELDKLTNVVIPNSVTYLGPAAFAENPLESITLSNRLTSIESSVFQATKLSHITIPEGVTQIKGDAFLGSELKTASLPDSLEIIEGGAFLADLQTLTVPGHVTSVGPYAFGGGSLTEITFEGSGTVFDDLSVIVADPNQLTLTGYNNAKTFAERKGYHFKPIVSIELSPNGDSAWADIRSIRPTVTAYLAGDSVYKWSDSTSPPEADGWSALPESGPVALPEEPGLSYMHVRFTDKYGVQTSYVSGALAFEFTPPTVTLASSPSSPTTGNVRVTATISDADSGIAETKYALGQRSADDFNREGEALPLADGVAAIDVPDNGWISVYARDHAGNETVKQLQIANIDREKPVLTLKDEATVSIARGATFTDPGATALDNLDGDITANVTVSGDSVDTNKAGTYVMNYDVTDRAGNAADRVTRTVKVIAPSQAYIPPPLSDNTGLKKLEIKANGQLLALSESGEASYKAETDADEIEWIAEAADSGATLSWKLNGETLADGKGTLKEGENLLELTVQAANGTKKGIAILILKRSIPPEEASFTDINGHWAESLIRQAAEKGIARGYPDGTFRPDASISRAEFAIMLAAALKLNEDTKSSDYSDAGSIDVLSAAAIAQLTKAGIAKGYPDGTFRPQAIITRAEMAAMIARAFQLVPTAGAYGFADGAHIPAWARDYVEALLQAGALNGRGNGQFDGSAEGTRAEAIAILMRLLNE